MAMYGASKAAVLSLTKSMALEFAADGVRVNAIGPPTAGHQPSMDVQFESMYEDRGRYSVPPQ